MPAIRASRHRWDCAVRIENPTYLRIRWGQRRQRNVGPAAASTLGALEERQGAADLGGVDGDQLPAVLTPGVEDLLGVVRQQGHGRVLPLGHLGVLLVIRRSGAGSPR